MRLTTVKKAEEKQCLSRLEKTLMTQKSNAFKPNDNLNLFEQIFCYFTSTTDRLSTVQR